MCELDKMVVSLRLFPALVILASDIVHRLKKYI